MSTSENAKAKGWDRSAVTFRLSVKRVNELKILCDDEQLSPTAALDLAINLARSTKEDHDSDNSSAEIAKIQDLIVAQASHTHRTEELLTVMAQQIHELKTTITTVANADLGIGQRPGPDVPRASNLSLRSWLDREAVQSTLTSFVVKAQWRGIKRLEKNRMQLELLTERLIAANTCNAIKGKQQLVQVLLPQQPGIFSQLTSMQSLYFKCKQNEKNEWHITVHEATDTGLGSPLLILRA
ncbi:hypothetical protein [Duganella sp. OV510]|nr:hypothetical protein [Duganella sp. OV510]SDG06750.1 hypothetical protein SAMN05216320_102548 [Duganella sp. OV458]SDI98386.1 hypothetical protein SAMN05428973_1023 [Duganella sp. OV510]